MEQLYGGFTLSLPEGTFPLSTDSMVLAHFVRMGQRATVLDLGSGCGTLGHLLCARYPGCHVTGVELDETAHAAAVENIHRNGISSRLDSICQDIRSIPQHFAPGSFQVCVSNPPYFSGGPASKATPTARREDHCTLEELFHSAAWAVKYGGDFFLVHKPERLSEICVQASKHQMEVKRLCLVRHKPTDPVSLILVQCRKGAKPGLVWEELCLFESDGTPTESYRTIYHL